MRWPKSIAVLCGGVGAARFLTGLVRVFPEERITAIVNTGDDIILHGLHISPDIDIVTYSLAGIVDEEKGWGISADTFSCLSMLKKMGEEIWFQLGDMDLATHLIRTDMLEQGYVLSEITDKLRRSLGVGTTIIPMSNEHIETRIVTGIGDVHFQEYLVKRGMRDKIISIKFKGVRGALPAPGVIRTIGESDLLVIAPSNPFVSTGTILSIRGVRQAMRRRRKPSIAISPIIGGRAVKGPLALMFRSFRKSPSALEVARMYSDIIDAFVIDTIDIRLETEIRKMGLTPFATDILMVDQAARTKVAKEVLRFSRQLC